MDRSKVQVVLTVACGLSLALSWFWPNPYVVYFSVLCGMPFAVSQAWTALREKQIDVNFLMILAAVGSIGLGRPSEAAALLFLFSLSATLEAYALGRTHSAIEGLMKLRPDTASRIVGDKEEQVPVASLEIGDLVRVIPFNQIPCDGEIVSGQTSVNESAMTGEAQPVDRAVEDRILAGTQNLEGSIVIRVTKKADESTLSKIVKLVEEAQDNKASGEKVSEWFGKRYTIAVVGVLVLSVAIRLFWQAPPDALYASFTLLVALSPCAVVIAAPSATLSALAWAAQSGILARGGQAIETAAEVNSICVDKTGTLTKGTFQVQKFAMAIGGGDWQEVEPSSMTDLRLLGVIGAAESQSSHPIATAIQKFVQRSNAPSVAIDQQSVVPGLGLIAESEFGSCKIGRESFVAGPSNPPAWEGMTKAFASVGDTFFLFGLRDEPRAEARGAVEKLRALGVTNIRMLTGDSVSSAEPVGKDVGVTEIHAALLPTDKQHLIESYVASGEVVMMVGDGVNDAPSLARANLGVAMGGLGSDIALQSADVVLMRDNLSSLVDLVHLGRATKRVIIASLAFSIGMIVFLMLGTFLAEAFAPALAKSILPWTVLGHEGSTVLVILNGLRMLRGPAAVTTR